MGFSEAMASIGAVLVAEEAGTETAGLGDDEAKGDGETEDDEDEGDREELDKEELCITASGVGEETGRWLKEDEAGRAAGWHGRGGLRRAPSLLEGKAGDG
jgi:hypothetical protein